MKLYEFKAIMISQLYKLKTELLEKYPGKKDRIEQLINTLVDKTHALRVMTISDYLHALHLSLIHI